MADMKISDLPAAPNVNDAQQFEVNDSGNSRRVTFAQVREKVKQLADAWYAPKTQQFQGSASIPWDANTDWNDLPALYPYTGIVPKLVRGLNPNGPSVGMGYASYFVWQHFHAPPSHMAQFAIPYESAGLLSWRTLNGGTWQPWKQVDGTSAFGRTLMNVADAAAARSAIGAGTGNSNVTLGYTSNQAKPGNWGPHLDTETFGQLPWSRLTGVPDSVGAAALPEAFGVGSYVLAAPKAGGVIAEVEHNGTIAGSSLTLCLHKRIGSTPYIAHFTYGTGWGLPGSWRNMGSLSKTTAGWNEIWLGSFLRIA